eukprot:651806-Hanusia_phi.AAC.1
MGDKARDLNARAGGGLGVAVASCRARQSVPKPRLCSSTTPTMSWAEEAVTSFPALKSYTQCTAESAQVLAMI